MVGLYSPVNLTQHASSAENIANIIKQGFIPSGINSPGFTVADMFQGPGKKVFTSTSPNLLSQYGDEVVDVINSAKNLRLPSGGINFGKKTIGLGTEIVNTPFQANKGMRLAERLRAGAYANSPLAKRLLQTGTTLNPNLGIGILNNPYFRSLMNIGKIVGSAPAAGIMTLFNSSGLNQGEEEFMKRINEQQNTITTGQQILGQIPQQIINQQIASRNPNRGNYQAPTMTAQQMVQEAKDTGGTVNPFEVTKAAQNERQPKQVSRPQQKQQPKQVSRPRNSPSSSSSQSNRFGRFGRANGGMVSIMDLLNRKV